MFVLVVAMTFVSIPKSLALGEDTIVLYHTNDIHGKINSEYGPNGKLMQIGMDVLKTVKSQTENALLVDAGDATQGTVLAKYSKGSDMIKMMNNEDSFIGPVNLGNPSERSILEFAKLIIEMTNSKSKIIYKPLPSDDPIQRKPDISLAKEKLNWEPKVDIREGISKTIEYFDNKLKELK